MFNKKQPVKTNNHTQNSTSAYNAVVEAVLVLKKVNESLDTENAILEDRIKSMSEEITVKSKLKNDNNDFIEGLENVLYQVKD